MRTTHQWGRRQSGAQMQDRFMHPALLVPCLLLWPVGVPVMLVLFLRHRDRGLDLRKLDHVLAVAIIPVMVMLIVRNDCLVLRCIGDYQIDSFTRGIEAVGLITILSAVVGLARWMRSPALAAPEAATRVASDGARACAAATLPSGRVLVFDSSGAVIENASGPFESVKHRVFKDLLAEGRFFWVDTSGDAFWKEDNLTNADGKGSGYVPFFQVTITAIEHTAAEWLEGGKKGRPAARTTLVWNESEKQEIRPSDIWKLIREASLAPRESSPVS
jgi:hypothetical protein